MKVLIIAGAEDQLIGSAAQTAALYFEKLGIKARIITLPGQVQGCTGCGRCWKQRVCVFDDEVNEAVRALEDISGLMVLAPVYYGEPSRNMLSFLDRLFHCAADLFAYRPAVSVCSARGNNAAKAHVRIHEFFAYADMTVITHKNGFSLKAEEDILLPADRLAMLVRSINEDGDFHTAEYIRELDYVR